MPNCAGQLDQKLDKNGDVAGFYTNLTDGPRAARGHAYRSKPKAYPD